MYAYFTPVTGYIRLLYSLLSGVLLGVPFLFPAVWPLSIVGAAMLMYVVCTSRKMLHALLYGFVAGITHYFFVFAGPLFSIFPFDWYGIGHPFLQVLSVGASLVYVSISCASGIVLFAVVLWFLKSRSWFDVLLIPSLWVVCEWVGSYVFYIFLYGSGSYVGPHFTMGYLGYVLTNDQVLLQAASLGGVYLLSFIVVGIGALLFYVATAQSKQVLINTVLLLCIVWITLHAVFTLVPFEKAAYDEDSLTVALVSRALQPTSVQSAEFVAQKYQELLALVAPLHDIDVLIFPENTTFLRSLRAASSSDTALIKAIGADTQGPLIIDSEDIVWEDGFTHPTVWFEKNGAAGLGSKQFLIPFGEYVPSLYAFLLTPYPALLSSVVADRNYKPGTIAPMHTIAGVTLGVRLCNEVMSPELYLSQTRLGAEVLLNISSLSWFHGSPQVYKQMQQIAQVRAVESRRYFIQASNMAPAFVVNHYGTVVSQTVTNSPEVLVYTVPSKSVTTLYTRLGQYVVCVFGLVVLMALLRKLVRRF